MGVGNNKLKVDSANIESYIETMTKEYEFLNTVRSSVKETILEYYNNLEDTEHCSIVLEQAIKFLDNYQVCSGGNCKKHIEQRMGVFYLPFEEELKSIILPEFEDV